LVTSKPVLSNGGVPPPPGGRGQGEREDKGGEINLPNFLAKPPFRG